MKYKVIGYTDCLGFNVMPRQHELAARASSSSATSELEHGTRLAPLFARHAPLSAPLPHYRTADGALAALSGSSVQFTRDGRQRDRSNQLLYATRHDGSVIKHTLFISTRNVFIL